MIREPLIMVCTCEMAGRVRGKGFPASELPGRLAGGVGWIPTNGMISALGPIADSPFGAKGELLLIPDQTTETRVDFGDEAAAEHFILGDIRQLDGTPWPCCPREFLRGALAALEDMTGLRIFAAFEHEFIYDGVLDRPGAPYSLDSWRRQGVFGEVLTAALRQAGIRPDSFMPEYGARQFEITCAPAIGLQAADQAVILREITRASALHLGHEASFTPIAAPAGIGNGVHIHFSLRDRQDRPATHDAALPFGLSAVAAQFAAGVLHHLPALLALTAPSPVSYIRLRPNRFAPTTVYLAEADRETSLRVCPPPPLPGTDMAGQFNLEFRAADASASPYLALGALVRAGVDGIRRRLPLPSAGTAPPLPASLDEALTALEGNEAARDWMAEVFLDAYLRHKRAEIRMTETMDEAERCALYAQVY
ncbi:MAG TPA: glutamine synthetase family protein [Acetobacteraceae bacterium]